MLKNTYSVGQVNAYIKNMFAQDFMLKRIRIKGEVSNCKYHTSGHIYFTLKDEHGTLSAVMFAGDRGGLSFKMKEGDRVVATGSVSVYEKTGSYQLYAKQIELDGEGDLFQKFERLKRELEEMGMFSSEYKQSIPRYVKRVGIVTAPTGAAIQDIQNIAKRRNPYVQLILYPALVQGEGAAQSIVQGIFALEQLQVDVIIVGRGGGSIEDLWAFNEEAVARAIFECRIPIISAVGHETDWTIADFVADMRAPTPSAAAELAIYEACVVEESLMVAKNRFRELFLRKLDYTSERLQNYATKFRYLSPQNQLREKRHELVELESRMQNNFKNRMNEYRHRLALLAGRFDGVSPTKKLSGGYAFLSSEHGKPIHSVSEVAVGEELQVHLLDGVMRASVLEVNKNE